MFGDMKFVNIFTLFGVIKRTVLAKIKVYPDHHYL